jgi:hypothetical protein
LLLFSKSFLLKQLKVVGSDMYFLCMYGLKVFSHNCFLQIEEWGLVEGGHDIDIADVRCRVAAASVFLRLL